MKGWNVDMTTNRSIKMDGGLNFRDLGGLPTIDGHTVKWHKLVRSAGLDKLTTADSQRLADYGVVADVDFRSKDERHKSPDQLPKGATYHFLPVFPDDDKTDSSASREELQARFSKDATAGHEHMLTVYRQMITLDTAQAAYRAFFQILLANTEPDQAVLFHCTMGKDRTGIGAFLLLSALNVDPQVIKTDYLATNDAILPRVNDYLKQAQTSGQGSAFLANIRALSTVDSAYYDTATKLINTQYGGVQDYLRDVIGLTHKDRETLRALYLD